MARLNLLEETRYEKLPVSVYGNQQEASVAVAARIATLIRDKQSKGKKAVLGLATGVTPIRCVCRTDSFTPGGWSFFPRRDHFQSR
jgi:glucosamine-6-phosphate deaminase